MNHGVHDVRLLDCSSLEAARLIRDKGEAVYDPKTGQRVVPPCEKTCQKDPSSHKGIVAHCHEVCVSVY